MSGPRRSAASTALTYALSLGAVIAVTAVMLLIGMVVRIEAYPLVYVLLVGLLAWRYGPGPGRTATVAAVILADFVFLTPFNFGLHTASDVARLLLLLVAGLAVTQVIHLQRASHSLLAAREEALATSVFTGTRRRPTASSWPSPRAEPYDRIDWEHAAVALPLGTGITGLVASTRKPILVADASRDPRMFYPPGAERLVESVLAVPMVAGDRLYGVLSLAAACRIADHGGPVADGGDWRPGCSGARQCRAIPGRSADDCRPGRHRGARGARREWHRRPPAPTDPDHADRPGAPTRAACD